MPMEHVAAVSAAQDLPADEGVECILGLVHGHTPKIKRIALRPTSARAGVTPTEAANGRCSGEKEAE